MLKTDDFFKNNQVISFIGAALLSLCLIFGLARLMGGENVRHDPAKMLELRAECLKNDPGMFTTTCDSFAEKYSRLP